MAIQNKYPIFQEHGKPSVLLNRFLKTLAICDANSQIAHHRRCGFA